MFCLSLHLFQVQTQQLVTILKVKCVLLFCRKRGAKKVVEVNHHGFALGPEEALPPARHRRRGAAVRCRAAQVGARSRPAVSRAGLRRAFPRRQQGSAHQRARGALRTPGAGLSQLLLSHSGAGDDLGTVRALHGTDPWGCGPVAVPQVRWRLQQGAGEEGVGRHLEQSESLVLQGPSSHPVALQSHHWYVLKTLLKLSPAAILGQNLSTARMQG